MGDVELCVEEARACQEAGLEISNACARTIASMWHSGQNSVSYSFVSRGAVPDYAGRLLNDMFTEAARSLLTGDDKLLAEAFRRYLHGKEGRPAVQNWHTLWVDRPVRCTCGILAANGPQFAEHRKITRGAGTHLERIG